MAFPIMAVAGMGMQAAGDKEAAESTIAGAQAEAEVDALNRAFQEKLFAEEMERLRPRHETAVERGLPLFQQYMQGGLTRRGEGSQDYRTMANPDYDPDAAAAAQAEMADYEAALIQGHDMTTGGGWGGSTATPDYVAPPTPYDVPETVQQQNMYLEDMPLYNMQNDAAMNFLSEQGMANPYSMNRFGQGLEAAENDAGYARLNDMLQIGMGASSSAGQGAQNFATGQANSLINTGNVLARGNMQSANIKNSMYGNLAGQAGSIPAYMYQNQQTRPTNLQGPEIPYGGIR